MMAAAVVSCNQQDAECKALVGEIRSLGKKLAAAQSVTSSEDANAQQVAMALRTFAKDATSAGQALTAMAFTVPELQQVASEASSSALALADSAGRMVEAAERLKGSEPARYATNIQSSLANAAATSIKRHCASSPTDCTSLSKVLLSRPPFPNGSVDPAQAAVFNDQAQKWLVELAEVELLNPELQKLVANLKQTTSAYATALVTLAANHDSATELNAATKTLSLQIEAVSAAMTKAQAFCKQ